MSHHEMKLQTKRILFLPFQFVCLLFLFLAILHCITKKKSREDLFIETDMLILKFIWKYKWPQLPKTVFKKKNKVGKLTLPDSNTHIHAYIHTYIYTVTKAVWSWCKDRQKDHWKRTDSRNKPTHIWSINFQQSAKAVQWGKDNLFQQWY